jgi:hypothetical protein
VHDVSLAAGTRGDGIYLRVRRVERVHLLLQVHLLDPIQQPVLHARWFGGGRFRFAVHGISERFQPALPTRRRRHDRCDIVVFVDILWRREDAEDVGAAVDGGGTVDLATEKEHEAAFSIKERCCDAVRSRTV